MKKKVIIKGAIWDEEMFFDNLEDARKHKWTKFSLDAPIIAFRHCEVCGRSIPDDDLSEYYVVEGSIMAVSELDGSEREVSPCIYCDMDCFEEYIKGHGPN